MTETLAFEAVLSAQGFLSGIQSMVASLTNLQGIASGIGSSLKNLGSSDSFKQLQQSISQVNPQLGSMVGSLGKVTTLNPGILALGAAFGALTAAMAVSVGTAAQFQQSMANVAAVTGQSVTQSFEYEGRMVSLSGVAREAGASTVFSASQASEAMYYMAASGMKNEEIVDSLQGVLDMAAAGMMDLGTASDITVSALAQFGMEADQAGRVSNVLAATAANSNTTIEAMGHAFKYIGPVAGALGHSIEETSGALGVLANAGFKGEMGGTALRNILADLMAPTKANIDTLSELGLTMEDVSPTTHSLAEILDTLGQAGITTEQAMMMFGARGGPAFLSLMEAGPDKVRAMTEAVTGTNKAAEMAATQTATLQGAMKAFFSAVEEVQISLGNLAVGPLEGLARGMTTAVRGATSLGQGLHGVVTGSQTFEQLKSTVSSLGEVATSTFSLLAEAAAPAWEALGGGDGALKLLQKGLDAVSLPARTALQGIEALAKGMSALISAATPIASMIGSQVVGAVTQLNTEAEKAKAYIQALTEAVQNTSAYQTLASAVETVQTAFSNGFEAIQEAVPKALEAIKKLITDFIAWVSEKLGGLNIFGGITEQIGNVADSLPGSGLLSGITGFFDNVAQRANEIYTTSQTLGTEAAKGIATGIEDNDKLVADAVEDTVTGADVQAAASLGGSDAADEFWKAFEVAANSRERAGVSLAEAVRYETGLAALAAAGIAQPLITGSGSAKWKNEAYSASATIENLEVTAKFTPDKNGGMYRLYIAGKEVAHQQYTVGEAISRAEIIEGLLKSQKVTANEGQLLTLSNKGLEAELWEYQQKVTVNAEPVYVFSEADQAKWLDENRDFTKRFGDSIANQLMDEYDYIEKNGSDRAKSAIQTVMEGMMDPVGVGVYEFKAALADLEDSMLFPEKLEGWEAIFNQQWRARVANIEEYADAIKDKLKSAYEDAATEGMTEHERVVLEGLKSELEFLQTEYPETFAAIGGESALAFIDAILSGKWEEAGRVAGEMFGEGAKEAAYSTIGTLIDSEQLKLQAEISKGTAKFWSGELGDVNKLLSENVKDRDVWWQNLLKTEQSRQLERINQGFGAEQAYWDRINEVARTNRDYYTNEQIMYLNAMTQFLKEVGMEFSALPSSIQKSFIEAMSDIEQSLSSVKDATKSTSVGFDQLKDAAQACGDCVSSAFGDWQESQPGLFQGSYLGESAGYYEWKMNEMRRLQEAAWVADQTGAVKLGMLNNVEPLEPIKREVQFEPKMEDLDAGIKTADESIQTLQEAANPIEIGADTAPFLSALDAALAAAAASSVSIPIYYYEAGSGSTSGSVMDWVTDTSWMYPSYDVGTPFVPYDQKAQLHYGERVLTAEENAAYSDNQGGNTVQITTIVQADSIYSKEDIEAYVNARDRQLEKAINERLLNIAKSQ